MARSKRFEVMPKWKRYLAIGNPSSKQRRLWRQEHRAKAERALRNDPENFQDFSASRTTSIYDWY